MSKIRRLLERRIDECHKRMLDAEAGDTYILDEENKRLSKYSFALSCVKDCEEELINDYEHGMNELKESRGD
jgi:hypothetical protein